MKPENHNKEFDNGKSTSVDTVVYLYCIVP